MADAPAPLNDPFAILQSATSARVGLGRAGQGLPTAPMLALQLAGARARDAVYASLDIKGICASLNVAQVLVVDSAAQTREAYLQSPDLGRQLGPRQVLPKGGDYDLAIVIADGLSAHAVHASAGAVARHLIGSFDDWRVAPVVIARQGRVAIGDPIAAALGAASVVVLIGERPGLSAADSLSAYVTWDPRPGRRDSERNCVSNIRSPSGLAADPAAEKIAWLLREAKRLGFSGVALKERQDGQMRLAQSSLLSS